MDYFTSATKKLVLYFHPFLSSTTGHSTVRRIISQALPSNAVMMPLTSVGQLESWLARTTQQAHMLLVDFPDTGYRRMLKLLRDHRRLQDVPFVGVDMFAPLRDPEPESAVLYDYRIAFDPYSKADDRPPAHRWLDFGPFITSERQSWPAPVPEAELPTLPSFDIACVTGMADERDKFLAHVQRLANPRAHIVNSRLIKPEYFLHRLHQAQKVWAAGGYSMTWELAAHIPLSRVEWLLFNRPSEDCPRRILRARQLQEGDVPLLIADPAFFDRNMAKLSSALERILAGQPAEMEPEPVTKPG